MTEGRWLMKRVVCILLALSICTVLGACTGAKQRDNIPLFERVCSAEEGLVLAGEEGYLVFEDAELTSGESLWKEFLRSVESSLPAGIMIAKYYTLNGVNMSEELYESEKANYPKLYLTEVEYDGSVFKVKTRASNEKTPDSEDTYKFMKHFEGDMPSSALYRTYDSYVLVNDDGITMEDIEEGMYSSLSGKWVKHYTVYRVYDGKKGGK